MSWDVSFQDLPDGLQSIADVPDDFLPIRPLCSRAELHAKIRAIAPETDFSDPAWATLDADGFSIELNIGDEDPVMSLMVHVRGDDEAVLGIIRELASALGRAAIDCSAGELIDFGSPEATEGYRKWRAYRDRILAAGNGRTS